jgi:outer membrane protein assembly factor BamB
MQDSATSPEPQSASFVNPMKPMRIWIPLLLLPLMVIARFVPDIIQDPPANIWMVGAFGPVLLSLAILLWFVLVSRARWWERLLGVICIVLILAAIMGLSHESFIGPPFMMMTIPLTVGGFALGAIAFGRTLNKNRLWYSLAIAALLGGVCALLKTDGVWGDFKSALAWRWDETAEDRLLAKRGPTGSAKNEPLDDAGAQAFLQPQWPNLRGPNFDSVQRGLRFSDDWEANPPKELWRIEVGPAWSSFAVAGQYLVTQEQRGESEFVVCYDAETGKEVWTHSEPGRFFESLGGLGPRATPTIHGGYVYAFGADGKLIKLDPKNGEAIWKVNVAEVAKINPPMWGFSSSPLVHQGTVIVHAGSEREETGKIFAFNDRDGEVVWSAPAGKMSYASVQTIDLLGTTYLALQSDLGLHLYKPDSGEVVLDYLWEHSGYRALQPQVVDGDKILMPTGLGSGTRLVQASLKDGKLELEEVWTTLDMKPDFNDVLVHKGHIYGFDNRIFGCISLQDGKRTWKGGRYEKGQAILLADSDLIIVVSERGELVQLRATPDKLEELAKFSAMKGKTWNHPVLVGNRLYVRNAVEAICYELATVDSAETVNSESADSEKTSADAT